MILDKYTFLAIAPGSFNIAGRHYILEVGKPFEVDYATAKQIASPNFPHRKSIRAITPLPTKEELEEYKKQKAASKDNKVSQETAAAKPNRRTSTSKSTAKVETVKEEPKSEPVVKTSSNTENTTKK